MTTESPLPMTDTIETAWDAEVAAQAMGYASARDAFEALVALSSPSPGVGVGDGDLGFNPYDDAAQAAMAWTLDQVGAYLGVEGWERGDGSESVEGDVNAEIGHILQAAGLIDDNGEVRRALSSAPTPPDHIGEAAEKVAGDHSGDQPMGRAALPHHLAAGSATAGRPMGGMIASSAPSEGGG